MASDLVLYILATILLYLYNFYEFHSSMSFRLNYSYNYTDKQGIFFLYDLFFKFCCLLKRSSQLGICILILAVPNYLPHMRHMTIRGFFVSLIFFYNLISTFKTPLISVQFFTCFDNCSSTNFLLQLLH